MNFLELATNRYSVRKFKDAQIEPEKMNKILEAAKVAPTAVNFQPQKIYIIKSPEAMEKLKAACSYTFGAPQALVIAYDTERVWKNRFRDNYNSGEVDSAIAACHMMLEAWELGIGTCWVGAFDDKEVSKVFNLPDNIKPVVVMPMGYPAEDSRPYRKMHDVYRPLEEMVEEL